MKTRKSRNMRNRNSSLPFANYTNRWSRSNKSNMSSLTFSTSLTEVRHLSKNPWNPIKSSAKTKNMNLELLSPIACSIFSTGRYLPKEWWNAWLSFHPLFFRWKSVYSFTFSSKKSCCCKLRKVGLAFLRNIMSLHLWRIVLQASYQINLEANTSTWRRFCITRNRKRLKNKSKLKPLTTPPLLNWNKSRCNFLPWNHRNEVT